MNPYTPIEQENVTEEEASHPVDASPGHIIHKKDYDSMIQKKNTAKVRITLGFIKNETLVFVNFSTKGASIFIISVAIIKRRSR